MVIKTYRTFLTIVVSMLLYSAGAWADPSFRCELKPNQRAGWVPPVLLLSYNEGKQSALIYDYYAATYNNEKPFRASFRRRDEKAVQMEWAVDNIKIDGVNRRTTANFSIKFRPVSGRITMSVNLIGVNYVVINGNGRCKPLEK